MKQLGQIYTHQFVISESDQCLLHDQITAHKAPSSKLACQSNGWTSGKIEYKGDVTKPLGDVLTMMERMLNEVAGCIKPMRYWFVSLEPGGVILWHNHNQSDWSAVFYPHTTGDDGGHIMFEDGTTIRPHAGLAVFFPGTLNHKVRPYKGSTARLSIAFNRDIEGE